MAPARLAAFIALAGLAAQALPAPARADNAMGYRLLPAEEAARLPKNHGVLGLAVSRGGQVSDAGMTFEIIRVTKVTSGSPGQQAGLRPGDEIIAIDGRVFPSLATFAAYVGSLPPGTQTSFDTIPTGGGPGQAQRLPVRIGPAPAQHMSTGEKIAIGAGAAALLGCYELGCFHRNPPPPHPGMAVTPPPP